MANDQSNGATADTAEALRAEREDLEATAAYMRQMARNLDAMAERRKSFDAERFASFLQTKGPDMRIRVWAGIRSPEGFQWYKEWIARKKALVEQVLQHLAAFVQAAILWEEDLERRESRHVNAPPALGLLAPSGLSNEISAPVIEGGAAGAELSNGITAPVIGGGAVEGEAGGSLILTGASAASAVTAGVVVAAAGVVIYGAYKGAVEPGLKAAADANKIYEEQRAQRIYDVDHNPDYENTPERGWFLYPGESRWEDGTIRLSNGQIAVYANGTPALSDEEREAIADKAPSTSTVGNIPNKLDEYPKVIDPRTWKIIPFPTGVGNIVPQNQRASWGFAERANFIAEWYRRGYATPSGGWENYDIHHIVPREYGGGNDFWNLVPVDRQTHQILFNNFWRNYSEP